ncbi:MAG TPA: alpha/beta fold hydrolase [Gemmatimonadales bacterium]|nr:alpha/beta fold hydrolase [Gemmatimonadales bacterium]
MATPTLTKHAIPGALGPILIDVRSGGRDSPRPAVVITHGFKGFKDWGVFPILAERLARAGFVAVSLNVSGSGMDDSGAGAWPERFGHNTFTAEAADLASVIAELRGGRLGVAAPSVIGLLGHSRGGGTSILAAAGDGHIGSLVTWASIAHVDRWPDRGEEWRRVGHIIIENTRTGEKWPMYTDVLDDVARNRDGSLDIRAAAARVEAPWLIIHGSADTSVPFEEGQALFAASGRPTTELLEIKGGGHTFGAVHPWAGETAEIRQVMDRTVGWFGRTLDT